jgi:DNA-directed RNA polymerase specialized sigma24 family protein
MDGDDLSELLAKAKGGDRDAFRQLLTLRQRELRLFAAAAAACARDIEPALRAIAIAAYRALAQAPADDAAAWLRGVALARLRVRPEASGDALARLRADACRDQFAELSADPGLEALVLRGYRQLPQGARDLLTLRFAKGMPLMEVAQVRGMGADDAAQALATACARLDWRSPAIAAPGQPDPALYRLVDAYCAGTADDARRAQLEASLAGDPALAPRAEQALRVQLLAAAWYAPDTRFEDFDVTARVTRQTTIGGRPPPAVGPPSTRRFARPGAEPAARGDSAKPRTALLPYVLGGAFVLLGVLALLLNGRAATPIGPEAGPGRTPTAIEPVLPVRNPVQAAAAVERVEQIPGADPLWTPGVNLVPQALAAYGLRRLAASHAGALVRVRRSGDGTECDIGCTADGLLDIAGLRRFVGDGDGFVARWLDQSGHGNDLSQPAPAAQPRLVQAGAVELQNGRPALRFLKPSAQHLACPAAIPAGTLFAAVLYTGAGIRNGAAAIMGSRSDDDSQLDGYYPIVQRDGNCRGEWWLGERGGMDNLVFPTVPDRLFLWTSMSDGAAQPVLTVWLDGEEKATGRTTHPPVVPAGPTVVGGLYWHHRLADPLDGCLGEVVMLPPNLPANVRAVVLANLRAYWKTR